MPETTGHLQSSRWVDTWTGQSGPGPAREPMLGYCCIDVFCFKIPQETQRLQIFSSLQWLLASGLIQVKSHLVSEVASVRLCFSVPSALSSASHIHALGLPAAPEHPLKNTFKFVTSASMWIYKHYKRWSETKWHANSDEWINDKRYRWTALISDNHQIQRTLTVLLWPE